MMISLRKQIVLFLCILFFFPIIAPDDFYQLAMVAVVTDPANFTHEDQFTSNRENNSGLF